MSVYSQIIVYSNVYFLVLNRCSNSLLIFGNFWPKNCQCLCKKCNKLQSSDFLSVFVARITSHVQTLILDLVLPPTRFTSGDLPLIPSFIRNLKINFGNKIWCSRYYGMSVLDIKLTILTPSTRSKTVVPNKHHVTRQTEVRTRLETIFACLKKEFKSYEEYISNLCKKASPKEWGEKGGR